MFGCLVCVYCVQCLHIRLHAGLHEQGDVKAFFVAPTRWPICASCHRWQHFHGKDCLPLYTQFRHVLISKQLYQYILVVMLCSCHCFINAYLLWCCALCQDGPVVPTNMLEWCLLHGWVRGFIHVAFVSTLDLCLATYYCASLMLLGLSYLLKMVVSNTIIVILHVLCVLLHCC